MSLQSNPPPLSSAQTEVLSVSALNRLARTTLERSFPLLRVAGEVSNLTRAASGHLYFTLKDEQAQVRCTMWRNKAQLLGFRPENGMQVEARVQVTLYEARGDFQLSVEGLRQGGSGNLFEAFLRLKDRLAAEGLFDGALKRDIPRFPRRVGIVTSPAAAALQDVVAAMRRRAPHLPLVLYPAPVQGDGAGQALASAVRTASARAAEDQIDVLLVVRGGGSLEDLWAFNDESLARSIRACAVPVISGVGHETDVTIADFVADLRAATPTGAAELASGGFVDAAARLGVLEHLLAQRFRTRLNALEQRVDRAALRFRHPRDRLSRSAEQLDALARRLRLGLDQRIERAQARTRMLRLQLRSPHPALTRHQEHLQRLAERLAQAGRTRLHRHDDRVAALGAHLAHLAPAGVLARGYSITRDARGRILRSTDAVEIGDNVSIELSDGELAVTVSDLRRRASPGSSPDSGTR
ncbi:exodeoxyribonuclease VII large subunit [Rhodocyclaceae bacterium SMB388]